MIFGNILWEGVGLTESCVVLNDIHIDIMDYIKPAYCNEAQFRSMWTEFEWENRVNVTTTITYVYLSLCEGCFFLTWLINIQGSPRLSETHHELNEHGMPHARRCYVR